MPSTASATAKLAPTRRAMLQRFLVALDAFHAAEQSIDAGVDPTTGGELAEASRGHALSAATARLTEAFHVAIDTAWKVAADEARTTLWGGRPATVQAERVLESEIARQKAFASRFALDVARGETEAGRKIHEPTRAAMYTQAAEAGYQVGAALNTPDGTLIWWNLGETSRHCLFDPSAAVWTRRGDVRIDEVVVGDEAMTHRGRFRRVTAVHAVPVEQTSTNLGVSISVGERRISLTGDHILLSDAGWVRAHLVDCLRVNASMVPNEAMRGLWSGLQVAGPYEVPEMPFDMRMWTSEVLQGRRLRGVRPQSEGGEEPGQGFRTGVHGGKRPTNAGICGGQEGHKDQARETARASEARPLQASAHAGRFQAEDSPGTAIRGGGGRQSRQPAHRVSLPVDVGTDEWPNPRRNGDPPHQRGHDRRPAGELADDERSRPQVHASDAGAHQTNGSHSDGTRFSALRPGHVVYDLTVEEDHTFIAEGFIVSNCVQCPILAANSPFTRESLGQSPRDGSTPCRQNCRCFLTFKQLEGAPKPRTPDDINNDRRFEERVFNPPPVPEGMRLPNSEERGVLRDLEIQRNFARRKQADSEAAGDKVGARIWQRRSRDLTKEIRTTAEAAGVHHVPTFGVKDIINGRDIGQRDIDRLTHFRGIDGVTVSRAQVAAIHEAAAAAKADVLKILKDYPAVDPISKEDFRRLLRESGAPESAFGGPLFRLGTEAHDHDEAVTLRGRAAMGLVAAIEAAVPSESAVELPKPANWIIVNIVGESALETLELVPDALAVLGNAGRRTGVDAYRVEVGPLNDLELVAEGGVWVQGDREEVDRYLTALRAVAVFAVAPWQPMG